MCLASVVLLSFVGLPTTAHAEGLGPSSEALFTSKCAGCHMGGGNVVAAGATLKTEDLQRNGVASPEALYKIIYAGKGKMPGYGTDCAPKGQCTFGARLSDDEVSELASYVQARAAAVRPLLGLPVAFGIHLRQHVQICVVQRHAAGRRCLGGSSCCRCCC